MSHVVYCWEYHGGKGRGDTSRSHLFLEKTFPQQTTMSIDDEFTSLCKKVKGILPTVPPEPRPQKIGAALKAVFLTEGPVRDSIYIMFSGNAPVRPALSMLIDRLSSYFQSPFEFQEDDHAKEEYLILCNTVRGWPETHEDEEMQVLLQGARQFVDEEGDLYEVGKLVFGDDRFSMIRGLLLMICNNFTSCLGS